MAGSWYIDITASGGFWYLDITTEVVDWAVFLYSSVADTRFHLAACISNICPERLSVAETVNYIQVF